MSYREITTVTKTVTLTGKNSKGRPYEATVRALRAPEEEEVQAALLGGKPKAKTRTVGKETSTDFELEMDSPAQKEKTLLLGIESWNLDGDPGDDMDENGILTITAANLGVLTGGDYNKLYNAINDLTSGPDDEEKKD